ncbi:topoisomerase II [Citrobacter sp. MNAZ 1397]|uniref:topoisomerase II n=1 Tax=Citrobacter sp. MNAZ 1397 TaxID=2911205 RepID=UPI0020271E47|nr:topoisomerase II [Citrobacter sp. MNAZ 1397]MCL9672647.1 topoisomerase II [Citrobacter sp. MNAZ 1397]
MNWTSVLLSALVAGLAAALTQYLRRKGKIGGITSAVIIAVAILVWNVSYRQYIAPWLQNSGESQMDVAFRAISSMPTYQVLREQEPQLLETIRTTAKNMEKEGKTPQQIIDYIQPQIIGVQMMRLQNAPDENVIAYMQINMEQTAAIQKVSDDNCFRFLFPAVKGGINPAKILPGDFLMKRMNIDAAMMRAAYGVNRHTVTDKERQDAQQHLQPIIAVLVKKYGQDIEIMPDPRKGVGKEKVTCDMVQDLWSNVLMLPKDQAAGMIRLIMAPENQ